jgi:hypothetical protein
MHSGHGVYRQDEQDKTGFEGTALTYPLICGVDTLGCRQATRDLEVTGSVGEQWHCCAHIFPVLAIMNPPFTLGGVLFYLFF